MAVTGGGRTDWSRSGWVALAAFLLFGIFAGTILPRQAAIAERATGTAGSPDASFIYSPSDLYSWAESYGRAGREAYVRARYTFDVAWPLVYGFFLFTSIGWVSRRIRPASLWAQRARLAPVFAVFFDASENLSTSIVMARFPLATPLAAALAPVFTLLKWTMVAGSFGLLLAGFVVVGVFWLASRARRA